MVLPERHRKYLLIVASYVFYGFWSVPFIGVILLSSSADYWLSLAIYRSDNPTHRKQFLWAGIGFNLLILMIFKYANFFLATQQQLLGMLHLPIVLPAHLDIILPLGISFYTFEAISYLVDVYRGQRPAPGFLSYTFYIMYFPHLISGPIVRFNELSSQYVNGIKRPPMLRVAKGLEMIVLGMVFKLWIADPMASIVDAQFSNTQYYTLTSWSCMYAAVSFAVQLYFDFLGFTQMARGISLLFNIELPLNFSHPYSARNVSDFWHRWHISLSRWIRDYLFIPLGGSRLGLPRTLVNLIVVMVLAGFWHGARWNFLVWGFYWGVLLAGYHVLKAYPALSLRPLFERVKLGIVHTGLSRMLMVWIILTAGLIFRSQSLTQLLWVLLTYFDRPSYVQEWHNLSKYPLALAVSLFVLCGVFGPATFKALQWWYLGCPIWVRSAMLTLLVLVSCILLQKPITPFVYFQF
jgi:D-alanyl-lipoteichoic acid acyltransferase DltB (MBOAT superfamily)